MEEHDAAEERFEPVGMEHRTGWEDVIFELADLEEELEELSS